MGDFTEHEQRITAALDKISVGLAKIVETRQGQSSLAADLQAERDANAQLEERVRGIKEKQETMVAALQNEVATLRRALSEADADLQQLRAVNAELRGSNAALRQANADALPDGTLVNQALAAEVEALRALESQNRAEIDRALSVLEPMLEEAANA